MSAKIQILHNTDLFSLTAGAYAQGVNCQGVMGSGIAKQFRDRYPGLYESYKSFVDWCKSPQNQIHPLGRVHGWQEENGDQIIYNLFTQEFYGRDPKVQYASLSACKKAFGDMFWIAVVDGISEIAMPAIGSGLGGLNWDDVLNILEQCAQETDWSGTVYVALN